MEIQHLVPIIVAIFMTGVTITASLIAVIFRWLKRTVERNEEKLDADIGNLRDKFHDNVKSNTHRYETIRSEVSGLKDLILADVIERQKQATVDTAQYSDLLKRYHELRDFVHKEE